MATRTATAKPARTAGRKQAAAPTVKKQTAATSARKKTTTGTRSARKPAPITVEERQRMIEIAAYYRAAARGFQGGNPTEDWLEAELEVDRVLAGRTASAH